MVAALSGIMLFGYPELGECAERREPVFFSRGRIVSTIIFPRGRITSIILSSRGGIVSIIPILVEEDRINHPIIMGEEGITRTILDRGGRYYPYHYHYGGGYYPVFFLWSVGVLPLVAMVLRRPSLPLYYQTIWVGGVPLLCEWELLCSNRGWLCDC